MEYYIVRGRNNYKEKWTEYAPFETEEDATYFGSIYMKKFKQLEIVTNKRIVKFIR